MLKKCSLKVFCGCSYKTTWNSHTTPNYEKTFDAPNQRPYHFQTVKFNFSALARLYYLARPTKTAMLRRLHRI